MQTLLLFICEYKLLLVLRDLIICAHIFNTNHSVCAGHRARQFFQPIPSTACDVCRLWESCSKACGAAALQRSDETSGRGNGGGATFRSIPDAAASLTIAPILLALAGAIALL